VETGRIVGGDVTEASQLCALLFLWTCTMTEGKWLRVSTLPCGTVHFPSVPVRDSSVCWPEGDTSGLGRSVWACLCACARGQPDVT
jgi:hypothetical protein